MRLPAGADARLVAVLARPAIARVMTMLNRNGEEARLIGGAVRNALIDRPVTDADMATTASPETVMARAQAVGIKAVPTGLAHGTVTLVVDHEPVEVTTLREDVATDGRRAEVRFSGDWKVDALRRDFTVNALALSADGVLHDYAGGLADLDPVRIRFIGDPHARIAEDYLRILRFFRFHAAYGQGPLDPAGLSACIAGRSGLDGLSRERIRMEVLKLLAAKDPLRTLAALSDSGLWQQVTGGVLWPGRLASALPVSTEPVDRLAAVAVVVTEDTARLTERLRLSRQESARLAAYAEAVSNLKGEGETPRLRALSYRFGVDVARLALAVERPGSDLAPFEAMAVNPPRLPVRASDLLARGMVAGPAIGAEMKRTEAEWLAKDCP